jgi:hypothetical protein
MERAGLVVVISVLAYAVLPLMIALVLNAAAIIWCWVWSFRPGWDQPDDRGVTK